MLTGLYILWMTENNKVIIYTLFSISTILIIHFTLLPCFIPLILCILLQQCPVPSGIELKAWKRFHFACSALYFITSKISSLNRSIKMHVFSPSSATCQIAASKSGSVFSKSCSGNLCNHPGRGLGQRCSSAFHSVLLQALLRSGFSGRSDMIIWRRWRKWKGGEGTPFLQVVL